MPKPLQPSTDTERIDIELLQQIILLKECLKFERRDPEEKIFINFVSSKFETGLPSNRALFEKMKMQRRLKARLIQVHYEDKTRCFNNISYDFIEVSFGKLTLIVDVEFKRQFSLPPDISEFVPETYIGQPKDLNNILVILGKILVLTFKTRGLFLPPWQEEEYLKRKWLLVSKFQFRFVINTG